MWDQNLKLQVQALRSKGRTYGEIRSLLNIRVAKSTISEWCKNISLSSIYQERLNTAIIQNTSKGLAKALAINKARKEDYFSELEAKNYHLKDKVTNTCTAKIALAMLYLGEGSKTKKSSLCFGNSNPEIIRLFLKLLRVCYTINDDKLKCTVQCRADQDINQLTNYWAQVTGIQISKFYKAQVDPRTFGKKTKRMNYKGVCRIDYFSAYVFHDLQVVANLICKS